MKKGLLLIPLALLLVSLVACATPGSTTTPVPTTAPAKVYHWRLAQALPGDSSPAKADVDFAKKVLDDSGGRIVIDVHASGVLGDWLSTYEEVMRGTIELSDTYIGSVYDPRLELMSIPYLTRGWDDLKILYSPGGFVYEALADIGRGLGYETLAFAPQDYIGVGSAKPVPSPEDPDVNKGLKIRVWPAKSPELLLKRFGYIPTAIPFAEAVTSMQMGVVDGIFGLGTVSAYDNIRDLIKYWIDYRTFFNAYFIIMNSELWESLSIQDQKIIKDAALDLQSKQFVEAQQLEQESLKKLRDYGIEIVTFTPEQMDRLAEVAKADVWPELESLIGKKLMEGALNALK